MKRVFGKTRRRLTRHRVDLLSPRPVKVIEHDLPTRHFDDAARNIEPDASHATILKLGPQRLAEAGGLRRLPLREPSGRAPTDDSFSNTHSYLSDYDSNRNQCAQGASRSACQVADTIGRMADNDGPTPRRLTDKMVANVREAVFKMMKRDFGYVPGEKSRPGGQRAIADAIGISQATLNTYFIKGKRNDFGLDVLLALRAYFRSVGTGPQTLDELLDSNEVKAPVQVVHLDEALRSILGDRPKRKKGGGH